MWFSFTIEVRQIMHHICNSLQRRRHFCFDANPYAIGRRGLRRNRNVWAAASSELSHWQLESTNTNNTISPTKSKFSLSILSSSQNWPLFIGGVSHRM